MGDGGHEERLLLLRRLADTALDVPENVIDGTEPYPAYCLFSTRGATTVESLLKCVRIFTPSE